MSSDTKKRVGANLEKILKELEHGCDLMKVKNSKKQVERFFFVDRDKQQLIYDGSEKPFGPPLISIKLNQIKDIRDGTRETNKMFDKLDKKRMFCVVIGDNHRLLRLLAHSEVIKEKWVKGLTFLVQEHMFASQQKAHDQWINESFRMADRNESGGVELDEIMVLLKSMNADIEKSYVKKMFDEANTTKTKGRQNLDRKEFIKFFKLLTKRPEIEMLFDKYAQGKAYIDSLSLVDFLSNEQKMEDVESKVDKLMKLFEPSDKFKAENKLSIDGFRNLLLSNGQRLLNPKHKVVYQDMTQPLNNYYINSSHNTYLMEDQLKGPSSTEAYIKSLQQGCRCVELDCWDGPDGDPIIYHGHTLTSKIKFIDVINVIKQYAFEKTPYPVILSIENHCSVDQQTVMARYMIKVFGDMLYKEKVTADQLPSPDSLLNKILIKAKKLKDTTEDDEEVSDEDESADMEGTKSHDKGKGKVKLSKQLSDLVVVCKSVHFNGFVLSKVDGSCSEMSSLGEKKTESLLKDDGQGFVEHTQHQLVRVYPHGTRTDSSNYNPVPAWTVGSQIVALNFQTPGPEMWLNYSRFIDNGNCGYVLKPKLLTTPGNKFDPNGPYLPEWKRRLTVKIVSGFQLPKPEFNTKGEIIDPFVKIEVYGVPADCKDVQTCVVQDNGFTPQWNETFHFDLNVPDLAMIMFTVYDYDTTKNDFIGYYALPVNSMQVGYRQFYLCDKYGHQRGRSVILAHISFTANHETTTPISERRITDYPSAPLTGDNYDDEEDTCVMEVENGGDHGNVNEMTPDVDENKENINETTSDVEDDDKENVNEITSDVEENKENINETTSDVEENKENINEITSDVEENKENINEITSDVEENKENINEITSDVEENKENINEITSDVEENKENINEITSDVEENKENINEITSHVEENKENVNETSEVDENEENVNETSVLEENVTETLPEIGENKDNVNETSEVTGNNEIENETTSKLEENKETINETTTETEEKKDNVNETTSEETENKDIVNETTSDKKENEENVNETTSKETENKEIENKTTTDGAESGNGASLEKTGISDAAKPNGTTPNLRTEVNGTTVHPSMERDFSF